jgi:hypothetical protein
MGDASFAEVMRSFWARSGKHKVPRIMVTVYLVCFAVRSKSGAGRHF